MKTLKTILDTLFFLILADAFILLMTLLAVASGEKVYHVAWIDVQLQFISKLLGI